MGGQRIRPRLCTSVEGKEDSYAESDSKVSETQVVAPKYWVLQLHGELVGGFVEGGFGFAGEVKDKTLEDQ